MSGETPSLVDPDEKSSVAPAEIKRVFIPETPTTPAFRCYREGYPVKSVIWLDNVKPDDLLHILVDTEGKAWLGIGTRQHADLASGIFRANLGIISDESLRIQLALDKNKVVKNFGIPFSWRPEAERAMQAVLKMIPRRFVPQTPIRIYWSMCSKVIGEDQFTMYADYFSPDELKQNKAFSKFVYKPHTQEIEGAILKLKNFPPELLMPTTNITELPS